jgi:hypothetical protein
VTTPPRPRARLAPPLTLTLVVLVLHLVLVACGGPSRDAGWQLEAGSEDFGWLLSVWAPVDGPRYLVGGVADEGRIVTDAGGGFSEVAGIPSVPLLNWVHGFSATDIFVVGNGGTVLHFDGAAWTQQPTPTSEALWGVWGAAPNDVWAVGGRGNTSSVATLLHYDGDAWESVTLPAFQRPNVTALFKIWGTAADNIYAVGRSGVILHYQGESWVEEASGTGDDLIALYGTSASEIVAVGGRSNGRVAIWNGETWRAESLAPLPGLNGVFMRTPGVVHVVGVEGTIARLDLVAGTFREEVPATALDFHAIFGDSAGVLTAVGGNFTAAPGEEEGIAFVRNLAVDE